MYKHGIEYSNAYSVRFTVYYSTAHNTSQTQPNHQCAGLNDCQKFNKGVGECVLRYLSSLYRATACPVKSVVFLSKPCFLNASSIGASGFTPVCVCVCVWVCVCTSVYECKLEEIYTRTYIMVQWTHLSKFWGLSHHIQLQTEGTFGSAFSLEDPSSLCVCVCVCMCVCVCVCALACLHAFNVLAPYAHMCLHHMYTCTCTHVLAPHAHMCLHHMYTCTCTHVLAPHAHMCLHHMYTCTCTHVLAPYAHMCLHHMHTCACTICTHVLAPYVHMCSCACATCTHVLMCLRHMHTCAHVLAPYAHMCLHHMHTCACTTCTHVLAPHVHMYVESTCM